MKIDLYSDHILVVHRVDPKQSGLRLDAFLKSQYRKRSREKIKTFIRTGEISIRRKKNHMNLAKIKPSLKLAGGDEIQIITRKKEEPEVSFDYHTVHEDGQILILDKPANLPVHPAGMYFFHTLLIHLRTDGFQNPLRAEREYHLVHRIDKETSGLIILAKAKEDCAHLIEQFAQRKTQKKYLAIVHGQPERDSFEVDAPLGKARNTRIGLKVASRSTADGGQTARTDFRVIERKKSFALLECFPKTGRQHQIRVHLQLAGHPIVGDKLYSLPEEQAIQFFSRTRNISAEVKEKLILERHALHAAEIGFIHPRTEAPMRLSSPLPKDLRAFLESVD